ncbi:uncharacterized protein LOC122925251 [Bufo gargarizans]|uniref:uncharacterized protein LOC122925251 n=1 Tax=Bufo gargarizans TaxID=30331 RepID=UPI001CF3A2D5|nr:uncharacterized protein LOC122925251 [Bufo gargarizans]
MGIAEAWLGAFLCEEVRGQWAVLHCTWFTSSIVTSHNEADTDSSQMDEIHLIQSWSRYNNKVQALQQSLGLPSWQKSKSNSPTPEDTSTKMFKSGQRRMIGSELQREVLKHCGPSEFHAMMESYSADSEPGSPPMQKVLDKVLIRRSMAQAHRQKYRDEAIGKLEAAKEHLRKELKNLEAQNEFFGNGGKSQAPTPLIMDPSPNFRNRNEKLGPAGTDLLKGLATDNTLLYEVVEEIMNPNLSLQPQKMNPEKIRQLQRRKLEASMDHVLHLIEEEIILEVTLDMAKQVAADVFKRAMLSSEFESRFKSEQVQEYLRSTDPLNF